MIEMSTGRMATWNQPSLGKSQQETEYYNKRPAVERRERSRQRAQRWPFVRWALGGARAGLGIGGDDRNQVERGVNKSGRVLTNV